MGRFSYLCSECGDPIQSDTMTGEHCILMLAEHGEILEVMQGQYGGYGRVILPETQHTSAGGSYQEWESRTWTHIVDLHHNLDHDSGICAFHSICWQEATDKQTVLVSDNDSEQGFKDGAYKHATSFPQRPFFHRRYDKRAPLMGRRAAIRATRAKVSAGKLR